MIFQFCKKCAQAMKENPLLKEPILKLAEKGHWLCPNFKPLCGTKKGTQS